MAADTYTVERSLTINAAAEHIYDQIADFHRWTRWSPWEDLDPALERSYSGAESGIGAVYAWSGNRKAGQGRMEITDASRPSAVQVDLLFAGIDILHRDEPGTQRSKSRLPREVGLLDNLGPGVNRVACECGVDV